MSNSSLGRKGLERLACIAFVAVISAYSFSQSRTQGVKVPTPPFEIITSDYAHVMSSGDTDEDVISCEANRIIIVYVQRKLVSKKNLSAFSRRIKAKYSDDGWLTVFFMIDRNVANSFSFGGGGTESEQAFMKSTHGIYLLNKQLKKEVLGVFPTGMTEKDVDDLAKGERSKTTPRN